MIKNYFKIAFRNFWRHKLFTLINIIGLSIGISAAVVIYLIVHFDFTFDKFHDQGDRVYRVVTNLSEMGNINYTSGVCGPLAEAVKNEVTGLTVSAPFFNLYKPNAIVSENRLVPAKFKNLDNVILADERYFEIFHYKWLAGTAKNALNAPNQVVLTSSQAKLYFPSLSYDQILGRSVVYDTIKTTVTGIVQPLQGNTDFTFHDFISYSTNTVNKNLNDQLGLTVWNSISYSTQLFVKLPLNSQVANIEKQLNDILKKNSPTKPENKGSTEAFSLQPLSDIHFNEKYGADYGRIANKKTQNGLLIIAASLLLLGCINFVNLTTAQAAQRAKEIGIRKTMGSSRGQLIVQFLSETFIITLIAVIISMGLTPVILKLFADFIPPGVKANFLQTDIILFLTGLTFFVSFLSGFYPAVMLSGYKPVSVLKNQSGNNTNQTRNAWLRKSLTVTQFIIAQFFIMATVLVGKQIYYALHKDMGFKKDAIIVINSPWKNRHISRNLVFADQLRSIPQVAMVSIGSMPPASGGYNSTEIIYKDGKKEIKTSVELKFGDENYINLYGIKLLAGRNLQPGDTSKALLINATYAKVLGFKNPAAAVGNFVNYRENKKMEIAGVVADFHQHSLRAPINSLAILTDNHPFNTGTFHIALKPQSATGNEWKKAIAGMETSWKRIYPDDDFEYSFFDDNIAKFYTNEQHTSKLLAWATGLSILISCLGLLGLAIYTTNQRTKEIGVRKVLGASVAQIVALLSTELIWLIVLAFVLVTPVAWWAMNKWMQTFADRTPISWWIFILSGGGMLLAAVFTSSFQTVKAALSNPVKSLRSE